MNQMTRNLLTLVVFAVLLVASGCSSDAETDSETHWQSPLGACTTSSDCQDDLDCICGVCTSTCDDSSSACGEVDSAAECVVDEQQLPARCASQASGGGGVCLEPCTSSAACEQRDSDLTCENGRCASPDPGEQPDGGDSDANEPDADQPDADEPLFCDDGPVRCCDELVLPSGGIAFGVHDGPSLEYGSNRDPSVISGVWHGLRTLEQPEPLSCPDNADGLDLPCETGVVGFFEDDDKVEYEFITGLPSTLLETLPEDVAVDIEERGGSRRVVRQQDGVPLMAFNHVYSPYDAFTTIEFPGFQLQAATDPSQADAAVCLTRTPDECDHLRVSARLQVKADEEHVIGPGEAIDFVADGQEYRLWHVVSWHRYDGRKYGYGVGCADLEYSRLTFAMIWLGEASSQ